MTTSSNFQSNFMECRISAIRVSDGKLYLYANLIV